MEYISAQEAANLWGITKRRVQILCASNRIDGAVRIGNMWILPATAGKPTDKRMKEKKSDLLVLRANPVRIARRKIKSIISSNMSLLMKMGVPCEEATRYLISLFASELLTYYTGESSVETVARIMGCGTSCWMGNEEARSDIKSFIEKYTFCCDDALSWCYQYANKLNSDNAYSGTQFFTEKYMIATIVDAINISSRHKVFDPACGGGNFLLYCLDALFDDVDAEYVGKDELIIKIQSLLSRLIGYEIDPALATVASVNLRLKCLSMLTSKGISVAPEDILAFTPNIFYPIHDTVGGALDLWNPQQTVAKVGVNTPVNKDQVFSKIDAIVTNPPFQTVKRMPDELKQFLRKYYPKSKCDMCNAFLLLSQSLLAYDGIAGLVTQNSWMYLDSFISLREELLESCTFRKIWELGSNAFYDLNGEKSNVALVVFQKQPPWDSAKIQMVSLKTMDVATIEAQLSSWNIDQQYRRLISQQDILQNSGARFDMISSSGLRELLVTADRYEKFATPMQGTSTGNAKELIDFFWRHVGEKDWVLVSKGGGYSRWLGLNHYCVKWGHNGEFIKETKGSAIRNAAYFGVTQMVFSDTGTSGLNVRQLLPGQIFVASGPGIRIHQGKPFAHLAFLNSRFASYYIRLLSPKLTIAAGYIGKLPVDLALLTSELLDGYAQRCVDAKRRRLSKRANNIEFQNRTVAPSETIEAAAHRWFLEDIEDEWEQLQLEEEIDQYIFSTMALSEEDIETIDRNIGKKRVCADVEEKQIIGDMLAKEAAAVMDCNCCISRTKVEKRSLGCDGLLEYLSQKLGVSCEAIHHFIIRTQFYPKVIQDRYESLYIHALILSVLRCSTAQDLLAEKVLCKMNLHGNGERDRIRTWIYTEFNTVHRESMMNAPLFTFDSCEGVFMSRKEQKNG